MLAVVLLLVSVSCSPASAPALAFRQAVENSKPVALALASACMTSKPASNAYSVTVCLTSPANGATLEDNVTVKATATVSAGAPYVQRVVFYLNGTYLLMDYQSSYYFVLPTTRWVDGTYTLAVSATLHDGFTSQKASVSVIFKNGIITPPVNTGKFQPTAGRAPAAGSPFIVAAGGDGASGQSTSQNVVKLIGSVNPNLFLYLGDVYERGSQTEFYNWYGTPSNDFGRFRSITDPTVGNHEYLTSGAAGYFDYWNNIPNYYQFNANGWHLVSLNSNGAYSPTAAGSAQYNWLQNDLAALSSQTCTIVFYHHPYFNIGPEGPATGMAAMWQLMAKNKVDLVLNGHDHDYQRWKPLDANGAVNSGGVTEFVAGGAGHGIQTFTTSDARLAYSNDTIPTAFGVLALQLNAQGANFNYRNSAGAVIDAGVIPCKPAAPDTQAPSRPGSFTATVISSTQARLTWTRSSDNVGVVAYRLLRNGTAIGTAKTMIGASQYVYTDSTAVKGATYKYSIYAYDPTGNHSVVAGPLTVTMP